MTTKDEQIQREYYRKTAADYNKMHMDEQDEHYFAASILAGTLDFLKVKTILDVGAGTGRVVAYLKPKISSVKIIGVEPVKELREIGYANGLNPDELIDGNGLNLGFETNSFDLVCAFGVLHHVKEPENVIAEMLRVAKTGIFISDCNNFGNGSYAARTAKQWINALGLWPLANWIKTRGKGYTITPGDGLAHSYSVFNNFKQISASCKTIHITNTIGNGISPYKNASHVALLGIKNQSE
jgi:ubiquinone/menaquinone biosynthesis C-methylase UbiE